MVNTNEKVDGWMCCIMHLMDYQAIKQAGKASIVFSCVLLCFGGICIFCLGVYLALGKEVVYIPIQTDCPQKKKTCTQRLYKRGCVEDVTGSLCVFDQVVW